jgi:hypothetical protein
LFCRPAGIEFFVRHVESIDVSLGGLRIYSDEEHALGALLRLDLFVPHVAPVTFRARVMWVTALRKGGPARFEVGLAFIELNRHALTLLEKAIDWEMPGGGAEDSPARTLAHTGVEFVSDEPPSQIRPVPLEPPDAADEADARSLRPGALEVPGAPPPRSGFPVPARRAKREWTLGAAALLLAGGLAVRAGVVPRRPHALPALAGAVQSIPAPSPVSARGDLGVQIPQPQSPAASPDPGHPRQGLLEAPQSKGRRVYVDGLLVGETPIPVLVGCGKHVVKVGSSAREQSVEVPCGGSVTVAP